MQTALRSLVLRFAPPLRLASPLRLALLLPPLLFSTAPLVARADPICLNDCLTRGISLRSCQPRCAFGENPFRPAATAPAPPYRSAVATAATPQCLANCLNHGREREECRLRCSGKD